MIVIPIRYVDEGGRGVSRERAKFRLWCVYAGNDPVALIALPKALPQADVLAAAARVAQAG